MPSTVLAQSEIFTPTSSLIAGDQVARTRIEVPDHIQSANRASAFATDFQVTYSGFPIDEELAFQYAVDIWANEIFSTFPIEIEARFQPIGSGALATTTPILVGGVSTGPVAGVVYPIAFANAEIGCDIQPLSADMVIIINSSISWHTNTSTIPGPTEYDLATVALHEIAHGLGIATMFRHGATDCGAAPSGCYNSSVSVYDAFLEEGMAGSLSGKPNPSTALGFALTGNTGGGVFWNGANAMAANGSVKPQIEAPAVFVAEESINHLDEGVFPPGNANSLMTSTLNMSEVIHDIGPILRAMLRDMGWNLTDVAVSFFEVKPVGFTSLAQSFADRSSQAVSWEWDFDNDGFTDAIVQNPSFTFPAVGSYTTKLTINGNPALTHTETIDIFNVPTIPYYNDFDVNSGGFYCSSVTCDQWELGVATTGNFNIFNGGAYGGSGQSWVTNMASNHGNNTIYYLESPPFNLIGGSGDYFLRFNFVWATNADAGMNMQYSIDGGNTWNILGGQQGVDPNADAGWFDTPSIASLGNEIGWTESFPTANYTASYRINALVGNPDVRFRIKFGVGNASNWDGIQIDNFEIDGNVLAVEAEEPILPPAASPEFLLHPNPASDMLTLTIAKEGTQQGTFRLLDLSGKQVLQQSYSFEDQMEDIFTVRNLATGIYLYEWYDGRSVRRGKILKK